MPWFPPPDPAEPTDAEIDEENRMMPFPIRWILKLYLYLVEVFN